MEAAARRRAATREGILEAGQHCFVRDGYRATSMARVAREAGVSRAAVYLHFDDKPSLFRALVGRLHERAIEEARSAAASGAPIENRVVAILEAKSLRFFELLRGSPHAEEFVGEHHRLCGDLSAHATQRHTRILAKALAASASAGELGLARHGITAETAAELLLDTVEGIKTRARREMTPTWYRRRLRSAVAVFLAGLSPR